MDAEDKLEQTKEAFKRKLDSIATWQDFKDMIGIITKQKVINFVKANLQQSAQNYRDSATNCENKADDIDLLVTEVDGI